MRLTRSTKDRKKGCAYDPGVLNKQGVLKNQTLRYAENHLEMANRTASSCVWGYYLVLCYAWEDSKLYYVLLKGMCIARTYYSVL